jgi:hypothetical protein
MKSFEAFLVLYDTAFGREWSTSKIHNAFHVGVYADRLKELISCWLLERKQKTPKAYGSDVRNT